MEQYIVPITIGAVAFASTNIDGMLVLLGFFSDSRTPPRQVVLGAYVGMAGLIAISLAGSMISLAIPRPFAGLLGFIPLAIGLHKLYQVRRGVSLAGAPPAIRGGDGSRAGAVAAVTLANGGDNVGTYVPLFSSMHAGELGIVIALFLALTAVCCAVAYHIARHGIVGIALRRHGGFVLPAMLVALGVSVLFRTKVYQLI